MYRYVPYEEIDKNKWNGTVHYSPNGNIFGYYWYLKAVYKQWDAIVEDDYVSVIPILPKTKKELTLLTPGIGPYSVNSMTEHRAKTLISLMKEKTQNEYFPISIMDSEKFSVGTNLDFLQQELHLIDTYDSIKDAFDSQGLELIDSIASETVTFVSSIKPEDLLAQSKNQSKVESDALIRTMYNAIHRGLGWSQGITDSNTGKFLALSFYVVSHNVIHEIFHLEKTPAKYRLLLYDVFLRSSAGKPTLLKTYHKDNTTEILGFTSHKKRITKIKDGGNSSWWKDLFQKLRN